jgi:uncharacterized membrane protein YphA (DoxX/SURF4 family)
MLNRTHIEESWVAFARVFVGMIWLYEVILGSVWKIGTPASGVSSEWVGASAGDRILEDAHAAVADGTWIPLQYFLEYAIIPYAEIWANLITVSQVLFGVCMILGAFTRIISVGALVQLLMVTAFAGTTTAPIVAVGHIFALATDAGQHYGVDGWLTRHHSEGAIGGVFARLATLGSIPTSALPVLAAGSVIAALHFVLVAVGHAGEDVPGHSFELAALFGLMALGFGFAYQGIPRVSIGAELVRFFVGYRLFHEIFLSTDPTLNRMPGWAEPAALTVEFEQVVEHHFAAVGTFVEVAVLPIVPAWAVAFAVVQTAVAAAVLAGWRTQTMSAIGLGYLGVLLTLGFARYAGFMFGYLAVVWALGGHYYSLDAAADREWTTPTLSKGTVPVFVAVSGIAGGAALTAGVAPDAFVETMAGVVAGMIANFGVLFLCTVFFQHHLESTQIQPLDDARGTVVAVKDAVDNVADRSGGDTDENIAADGSGIDGEDVAADGGVDESEDTSTDTNTGGETVED